jgi:hypothetical protein
MVRNKLLLAAVVVAACVLPTRASAGGLLHKNTDDCACTSCPAGAPCAAAAPCDQPAECPACCKRPGLLSHLHKDNCQSCGEPSCGDNKCQRFWEWLTYHSEHSHCRCEHAPCCYPPLYTFFLCCGQPEGIPRAQGCETCESCNSGCARCRGH